MKTSSMMTSAMPSAPVGKAWEEVSASFDRFCLGALGSMLAVRSFSMMEPALAPCVSSTLARAPWRFPMSHVCAIWQI